MDRDSFLARVRTGLAGTQPAAAPAPYCPPKPPNRQDMTAKLIHEATAVGAKIHSVDSFNEAARQVVSILSKRKARRVIRGDTCLIRNLDLDDALQDAGVDVTVGRLGRDTSRDALRAAAFVADAGITSVDFGVAETGSLALLARPGQGRAISLLPPVHIAVLDSGNIVDELAALFAKLVEQGEPASALTFITGPSLTGDIEQKLTVGVHGPGELHLVVLSDTTAP